MRLTNNELSNLQRICRTYDLLADFSNEKIFMLEEYCNGTGDPELVVAFSLYDVEQGFSHMNNLIKRIIK